MIGWFVYDVVMHGFVTDISHDDLSLLSSPSVMRLSSSMYVMVVANQGRPCIGAGGGRRKKISDDHMVKACPPTTPSATTTLANSWPILWTSGSATTVDDPSIFDALNEHDLSRIFQFTCGVTFLGVVDSVCDMLLRLLSLMFFMFISFVWHCALVIRQDSREEEPPTPQQQSRIQERILSSSTSSLTDLGQIVAELSLSTNALHLNFRMSLDDNPMSSDLVQVHPPVPDSFSH